MSDSTQDLSLRVFRRLLVLWRYLRHHARQMKGRGLSPRDFSVMRFLLETGPATVGQIQAFVFRSASTASALVDKLEDAGYVTRTRSEKDNRVVLVDLTPAGRDVAEHIPLEGLPLLGRRLAGLTPARLLLIEEALGEIMALMGVSDDDEIA